MTRPYPFRSKHWLRVSAAMVVAALLAGCGSAGGGGANAAPGRGAGGSTASSGNGGGQDPSGASTAGSASEAVFVPVVQGSVGQSSHAAGQLTHASPQQPAQGNLPGVVSRPFGQVAGGGSGAGAPPSGSSPASSPTRPPVKVRVLVVTHTVVRYRTRWRTRWETTVRTVPPDIPAGAMLPSSDVVSIPRFAVGSDIVCEISASGARCDIGHHSWEPATPEPRACHHGWGSALAVTGDAGSAFLCTDSSLLTHHVRAVRPGEDVVAGEVRCEVRTFGVNCFVTHHHGFVMSKSGYLRY